MKTFDIPNHYRSEIITKLKGQRKLEDRMKKDFSPSALEIGPITFYLARHFGFCYGVENAIETSFKAIEENPEKKIYLLSEIIHNPLVNQDLQNAGVRFIMNTNGTQIIPWEDISDEDIVIIPAFGTTLEIEQIIKNKNLKTQIYSSTCPFVEKVWNKAKQIGDKGYSVVIHGKPYHEESRATFSHSQHDAPSVIVADMSEAEKLAQYILKELPSSQFYTDFKGQYSANFNPDHDLDRIGVVNQTTMLASDTQEIADFLKQTLQKKYQLDENSISPYFADTRDTLCYATNDNQSSVLELRSIPANYALVVGGYNSSNTSHLYELLEHRLPAFYIKDENNLIDRHSLVHWDFRLKEELIRELPSSELNSPKILITSGASCPDKVVENVMRKICIQLGFEKSFDIWKEKILAS